jgi:hypothetical protein
VIVSIVTSAARIEGDGEIHVTADVADAETAIDQLTFQWSASPASGTFIGTGRQVTWKAPRAQSTPAVYTLTLTVVENYTENGRTLQNRASSSVSVHYNDPTDEISGLSLQFLKDFTTYSTSAAACVRNFSDKCNGKTEELAQIANNRIDYHILGGDFHIESITYNADRTFAHITAPCTFYDIPTGGAKERVDGICLLTATYDAWSWWLCDSNFVGLGTTPYTAMGRSLMRRR